jgi:hypothetical protein
LASQRIEVAYLLEVQHQLEDVLDRNRVAQGIEADHALVLGHDVRLALGRRQVEKGVANGLLAAGL